MTRSFAAWLLIATAAAAPVGPGQVVQGAVGRVVALLDEARSRPGPPRPAAAEAARARAEVRRVAEGLFDFGEIARRTLSRHWAARSPGERQEFVALFTDLLERVYLDRVELQAGDRILYTGELVDGPWATVRSRVLTRRYGDTALEYRLQLAGGRWRVYDLLVDGVSLVAAYRSEVNRIIQSGSWEELLDRLRHRRVAVQTVGRR